MMAPCAFAKTSMDSSCYLGGLTSICHYTSTTNFSLTSLTLLSQVYRSREDRLTSSSLQNKSDPESIASESTNTASTEI